MVGVGLEAGFVASAAELVVGLSAFQSAIRFFLYPALGLGNLIGIRLLKRMRNVLLVGRGGFYLLGVN